MSLLAYLVVGLVAGFLASVIMKTKTGLVTELILGVVGAIVGGWIGSAITGLDLMTGVNLTSILVALVGALLVIFIYRTIRRPRA